MKKFFLIIFVTLCFFSTAYASDCQPSDEPACTLNDNSLAGTDYIRVSVEATEQEEFEIDKIGLNHGWVYFPNGVGDENLLNEVSPQSYDNEGAALKISLSSPASAFSASWYKDIPIQFDETSHSFIFRMKVKDENAGQPGWASRLKLVYTNENGQFVFTDVRSSQVTSQLGWTNTEAVLDFPAPPAGITENRIVRVYVGVSGLNRTGKVLFDNLEVIRVGKDWPVTIDSSVNCNPIQTTPKKNSYEGWNIGYTPCGSPIFDISENSFTVRNSALKIGFSGNSVNAGPKSAYFFKDVNLSVESSAPNYIFRMKVNDLNADASTSSWYSRLSVRYRKVGMNVWSPFYSSKITSDTGWTDSIVELNFPENGEYVLRVFATAVSNSFSGTVLFDDLEIFSVNEGNSASICDMSSEQSVQNANLNPSFGTAEKQREHLQDQFDKITNDCGSHVNIELDDNYFVATKVGIHDTLNLPEIEHYTLSGDGSLTLSPTNDTSAEASNYKSILAIKGNPNEANFENFTIDHNSQYRELDVYGKKIAGGAGEPVRASIRSLGNFQDGDFEDLRYKGLKIKNSDSIVSLYNPRPYVPNCATAVCEIGRPDNIIIDSVVWTDANNHGEDYDQSFVNGDSKVGIVRNSKFFGETWETAPRTAIEMHYEDGLVENNIIEYFQIGINVSGITRGGRTLDANVSNNSISISRDGILIWSQPFAPYEGLTMKNPLDPNADIPTGLHGVTIGGNDDNDGNSIYLYPHRFQFYCEETPSSTCQKYIVGRGIYFASGRLLTHIDTVNISNNLIKFIDHEIPVEEFEMLNSHDFMRHSAGIGGSAMYTSYRLPIVDFIPCEASETQAECNEKNEDYRILHQLNGSPAVISAINIEANEIERCVGQAIYFYRGEISNIDFTGSNKVNCEDEAYSGTLNPRRYDVLIDADIVNYSLSGFAFSGLADTRNVFVRDKEIVSSICFFKDGAEMDCSDNYDENNLVVGRTLKFVSGNTNILCNDYLYATGQCNSN